MLKKQSYAAPEAEELELKFEKVLQLSGGGSTIDDGTIDDWGTPAMDSIFDSIDDIVL